MSYFIAPYPLYSIAFEINCEKDAILAVVANKNDLYNEQKISDETGQKFADDIGAIFQSTSALSDSGIGTLFDNIGKKLIDPEYDYRSADKQAKIKYEKKLKGEKVEEPEKKVKLGNINENTQKKKGCC